MLMMTVPSERYVWARRYHVRWGTALLMSISSFLSFICWAMMTAGAILLIPHLTAVCYHEAKRWAFVSNGRLSVRGFLVLGIM